jgi:hypothetical protein
MASATTYLIFNGMTVGTISRSSVGQYYLARGSLWMVFPKEASIDVTDARCFEPTIGVYYLYMLEIDTMVIGQPMHFITPSPPPTTPTLPKSRR